ncbi:hypothetical protein KAU19_06135 [Candidatus Parcubacteria bacterium]|nr:hypothetical protein [Candidatus Parcubacteria bacterium]
MRKQFIKSLINFDLKREKIFDQGVRSYFMSKKGKKNTRIINELLCDAR